MKAFVLVTVQDQEVEANTVFGDADLSVIVVDFDNLEGEDTSDKAKDAIRRIMENYDDNDEPTQDVMYVIGRLRTLVEEIDDENIDDMLDDEDDDSFDEDYGICGIDDEDDFDEFEAFLPLDDEAYTDFGFDPGEEPVADDQQARDFVEATKDYNANELIGGEPSILDPRD